MNSTYNNQHLDDYDQEMQKLYKQYEEGKELIKIGCQQFSDGIRLILLGLKETVSELRFFFSKSN